MKQKELLNAVNSIYLSEKSKQKMIRRAKNIKYNKENFYMSKKKTAVLLTAAILVLGAVVCASSGIITSWSSSSSGIANYTELPTEQECISDIGYAPVLIKEFENGYAFLNASIVNNTLKDDAGTNVESFKSISLNYKKDNDQISISADKYEQELEITGDLVETIGETKIYYDKYKNKLVPGNYEMTEEDKEAEAKGEFVFSYGMDKVTISDIQNLYFEKDGIKYTFTQIDGSATVSDLVSMANEIITSF